MRWRPLWRSSPVVRRRKAARSGTSGRLWEGGRWLRRRIQAGLVWALMGLDEPHPDLLPRHLSGSDDVRDYFWALYAARGRLDGCP
jgi:hypothetical protein